MKNVWELYDRRYTAWIHWSKHLLCLFLWSTKKSCDIRIFKKGYIKNTNVVWNGQYLKGYHSGWLLKVHFGVFPSPWSKPGADLPWYCCADEHPRASKITPKEIDKEIDTAMAATDAAGLDGSTTGREARKYMDLQSRKEKTLWAGAQ